MVREKKNYLYVDGYNIINSWPNLIKIKKHSLEDARYKLVEDMAEFSSLSAEKVIVVFDAYKEKGIREKYEKRANVTIVYTKAYQTADSFIEKEIHRLARRENVRVATGDNQIQQLALERGAIRITANELRAELEAKRKTIRRAKKSDHITNKKVFPLSQEVLDKLDKIGKKIE